MVASTSFNPLISHGVSHGSPFQFVLLFISEQVVPSPLEKATKLGGDNGGCGGYNGKGGDTGGV